jgi:hypothetical protein
MKKITKPAEKEEFVYYSDFSGKHMGDICSPVEVKIDFNYGSKRDGANLILHLEDKDVDSLLDVIKSKVCKNTKRAWKKQLDAQEKNFDESMQFRDWDSCDAMSNCNWLLRELLDLTEWYMTNELENYDS